MRVFFERDVRNEGKGPKSFLLPLRCSVTFCPAAMPLFALAVASVALLRPPTLPAKAPAALVTLLSPLLSREDAPPLATPEPPILTPAQSIKGLYKAFNDRDADAAASFLAEDCVYEDLLLGPSTVCRGKRAFVSALRFHPAFITSALFKDLPFEFPDLRLVVDTIAEGRDTVGVEWHVEVGGGAFPLGRGLSQAKVDLETGLITRVVDIAEAPWRVVGILLLPFISLAAVLAESTAVVLASKGKGISGLR